MSETTADDIIRLLELEPHPEGGHYRETFRDRGPGSTERGTCSAIYYLLRKGEFSAWHRVKDASELWHWHGGSALELTVAPFSGGAKASVRLGPDVLSGERPQGVVPRGDWQTARPLGAWSLVGCTVAPGFEFAQWELAPEGWSPPD
ncbi:MAG: cupin domain-containing protein [Alphaproteobacteria bacterium]|nr:cupin domain-containing protein [Alphaproteobacteria bacterium]